MKTAPFALAFLPLACALAEPLSVGAQRQLLLDGRFFAERRNIDLVVHPPRKTGDVIVESDRPWTLNSHVSVLYDAGAYHMWHLVAGCVAYLRSKDGIRWEPQPAGTVDLRGQRRSNIVMGAGHGGVKGPVQGLMVFLDPNAPPEERFRLVTNPAEFERRIQIFSSPDGIRWKRTHPAVMGWRGAKHHLDSQNVIFWDDAIRKYVAYFRRNLREKGSVGRSIARAESATLAHFPDVEDSAVVFRPDEWDPEYPGQNGQAISAVDFYTNGAVRYPWSADAYVMFPVEYFHYGRYLGEFREEAPVNAGTLDVRFAASRDGIAWERYGREPFVRLGLDSEFDSRRIYMGYGIVPSLSGNEMYLYYLGTSDLHGWGRDEKNNRLLTAAGLAPRRPSAVSRLVLRRDGFVSARAPYSGGEFTTPPLRFTGRELVLNVDTSAAGTVGVELLDETGRPVPGRTLADCDFVHTTNAVDRAVKWRGASDLSALVGKPVRLRFVMRDADLYAFQFRD